MHDGVPLHPHAFGHVSDAVIVVGRDDTITYWNDAAERIYGWDSAEVIGMAMYEVLPVLHYLEHGMSFERALADVVASGSWHGSVVQPHRDGRMLTIDSVVRVSRTHGLIGVNRDITERSRRMAHKHLHGVRSNGQKQRTSGDTLVWQMVDDYDFELVSASTRLVHDLVGAASHEPGSRASTLYAHRPGLLGDLLRAYICQQTIWHESWWPHESGEKRLVVFAFAPVPPDYLICTVTDNTPVHQSACD